MRQLRQREVNDLSKVTQPVSVVLRFLSRSVRFQGSCSIHRDQREKIKLRRELHGVENLSSGHLSHCCLGSRPLPHCALDDVVQLTSGHGNRDGQRCFLPGLPTRWPEVSAGEVFLSIYSPIHQVSLRESEFQVLYGVWDSTEQFTNRLKNGVT